MPIKQKAYRVPSTSHKIISINESIVITNELFNAFGENKWFLTLDLNSGYWQVVMDPADKEKTAFTTREKNFEFEQDTTQATLFELVYGRTAILPVEIEVNTYLTEPITEDNFQETLLRRTYNLMETLENKWQRAADNI
ncbi:hypothetical protein G9A89_023648 [Geosiphon pyriformis]|nr:hypothetical protein G9A89_023648 [Geosiphon pyriformis]